MSSHLSMKGILETKGRCALVLVGAQCAMAAKSRLLGSACSLLPARLALRDLETALPGGHP